MMLTILIMTAVVAIVWIIYDIRRDDDTDRQIEEIDAAIRELEQKIRERQRNKSRR